MTGQFHMPRPPRTDDELYWAVKATFGVTIPRHKVCPDHVAPFTAFRDAYFAEDSITDPGRPRPASVALWHGSRGLSGKSFALSTLGLVMGVFLGAEVNLLGGSFAQSQNIKLHMDRMRFFDRAPQYMFQDWGAERIRLPNHALIRPLTASQKTVRGPHPPRLILDEIDEMEEEILHAALGQPMEQTNWQGQLLEPYSVMCSTWQNPDGTFAHTLKLAEERGWPIYRWCYRESNNPVDGWLSDRQIEEKKQSIPVEMWRVEYELGEPSIGNRAFDTACVDAMFVDRKPLREKVEQDYEEYTFANFNANRRYVAAADWGKERDYTVIGVFDVTATPRRLVYFCRVNRRPYPMMVGLFNQALKRYKCERHKAIHDGTGLGNVVADLVDTRAWGFTMTGEKRTSMLTEWVSAVEQTGTYEIPRIASMYSEHKYCRVGDLYSTSSQFHLPDTVAMAALAHRAAGRAHKPAAPQGVRKNPREPATWLGVELGEKKARHGGMETPVAGEPEIVLTV